MSRAAVWERLISTDARADGRPTVGRVACLIGGLLLVSACHLGNVPWDMPDPLGALGVHDSPTYVARYLMPAQGLPLLLAHPRLGQPAIRRPGEAVDVGWIAPTMGGEPAVISLTDGTPLAFSPGVCDADGVCHLAISLPTTVLVGFYGVCVAVGGAEDCSSNALAVVDHYNDPATIIHITDAHIGDGSSQDVFGHVIDAMNSVTPAADFAVFTGDAAHDGLPVERAAFIGDLLRARMPMFVVTGNHDFDGASVDGSGGAGIDGHLIDVGPELDYEARYGALRIVALSSGEDLDEDDRETSILESSGPDASQLDWLTSVLADTTPPTIAMFHHPIYNGLFATIGDARDKLKSLLTCREMRAVLTGHTHMTAVFDAVGDSRGLSLHHGTVPSKRWPLHYIAARATRGDGAFAVLHVGTQNVDYASRGLP
jgi:hypothetical protein